MEADVGDVFVQKEDDMKTRLFRISGLALFGVFMVVTFINLTAQVQVQQKKIQGRTIEPKIDIVFKPDSPSNHDKVTFTAIPNNPAAVKKVEFWFKAKKIGEDSTAPFTFEGGPYPAGVHTIGAISFDAAGKKLASKYTSLRITEAPLNLTFKFSPPRPTNRDRISVKADIPIQRNIRSMVFYLDAVKVGEDKIYPWEFKGGPYPAKRYSVGAVAFDIAGNPVGRKYTSLEVRFYPVELTLSHSPQNPTSSERITFTADASDRTDIAKVEFFVNARSVGEDQSYPWSVTAGPFPKGQITYGFVIYDKTGRAQGRKYAALRIE